MQLMPGTTAGVTVTRLGRPLATLDELFDPERQPRAGGREISGLYTVFGGNRHAVVAAYNAGEAAGQALARPVRIAVSAPIGTCANVTFTATAGTLGT